MRIVDSFLFKFSTIDSLCFTRLEIDGEINSKILLQLPIIPFIKHNMCSINHFKYYKKKGYFNIPVKIFYSELEIS